MSALPWYHRTTIYQIYPRSFFDSNGDGIGDLPGLIQKLDYLQALGFETIWSSPFFSSPQADLGYDISDYADIAPEYGTLRDALQLIEEVHRRDMKIVFDMVMNHTSDQHPWFLESKSSRDNPKADWYLWRDQPNNWLSVLGGSGWHFAPERGQYYWATFLPFQPDLNYHNPQVKQTMLDMVRFWLNKGVDGFRLDIFNHIYKDSQFQNNPFSFRLLPTEEDYSGFFQRPEHTVNLPESFEFAKEFRRTCNEFGERLSIGEVTGTKSVLRKFLGDENNNGLTLVFDFKMMNFQFTVEYFRDLIQEMEMHYPSPFVPVYVFSNHDRHRSLYQLHGDLRKAKLLHMLQLTVRGVPCMYYGEELGMTDLPLPYTAAIDPIPHKFQSIPRFILDRVHMFVNRDEVRTPMQWNSTKHAGFSNAEQTWLPVHKNYREINVQEESKDSKSLLNTIRTVLNIRRETPALQEGSLELIENLPEQVLGYVRTLGDEKIFILFNFGEEPKEFPFESAACIFQLSDSDQCKEKAIRLDGLGGMILK